MAIREHNVVCSQCGTPYDLEPDECAERGLRFFADGLEYFGSVQLDGSVYYYEEPQEGGSTKRIPLTVLPFSAPRALPPQPTGQPVAWIDFAEQISKQASEITRLREALKRCAEARMPGEARRIAREAIPPMTNAPTE